MAVRLAIIHARSIPYGIISKEPPPPTSLPWESVRRPVSTHHVHVVPRRLQIQNFEEVYFPRLTASSKNLIQQDFSNGHMFETQPLGDEQKIEI